MARLLTGALSGAATIAAAGTVRAEERRVLAPLAGMRAAGERTWRVQGRAAGLSGALMPLLVAAVLAVGGVRLVAGHLTPGDLLALSRYAVLAAGAGALAGALNGWVRAKTAPPASRPSPPCRPPPTGRATCPRTATATLALHGVHVTRDGVPLLDSVTLTLPGGTTPALVGPSGSGKSLLAAVAGRLTDPDQGTVLLDGTDLRTLSADTLRHAVAYAFERPALFGATIADAVACGPCPSPNSAEPCAAPPPTPSRTASRTAPAPPSPKPPSGGELQRLGLARAFTRPTRLLILDDATSSLDTVTAHLVARASPTPRHPPHHHPPPHHRRPVRPGRVARRRPDTGDGAALRSVAGPGIPRGLRGGGWGRCWRWGGHRH